MAPTTPILTGFDGGDEDPLSESSAWAASTIRVVTATIGRCRLLTNRAAPPTTATIAGESVWATSFGADQEVYCDLPVFAASGVNIYARIQNEGTSSVVAYLLSVVTTNVRFFRLSNTTFTQIGSAMTDTIAAGDSMCLRVTGTTLEAEHKPAAGSWTLLGDETDVNVTGAGKIGIGIPAGVTTRVDNFGGGVGGQQILRPDATIAITGWTVSGAGSAHEALSDDSDSSIITATAS